MYAKIVCVAFFLALASAHVRREAPASNGVDEFFKESKQHLTAAGNYIKDLIDGKTSNEGVQEIFQNATKYLLEKTQKIQNNIENDLKTVSDKSIAEILNEAKVKVEQTAQQLKDTLEKQNPQVADYTKSLQESIKSLVDEGNRVAQAVKPQVDEQAKNFGKAAKDIVDSLVQGVDKLKTKLDEELKNH